LGQFSPYYFYFKGKVNFYCFIFGIKSVYGTAKVAIYLKDSMICGSIYFAMLWYDEKLYPLIYYMEAI
jgi:hypothetical protein